MPRRARTAGRRRPRAVARSHGPSATPPQPISVLVSLAAEVNHRLHDAVADARDQGYTWDQIAERLATTTTTARRRFSAYSAWRAEQSSEPTE